MVFIAPDSLVTAARPVVTEGFGFHPGRSGLSGLARQLFTANRGRHREVGAGYDPASDYRHGGQSRRQPVDCSVTGRMPDQTILQ